MSFISTDFGRDRESRDMKVPLLGVARETSSSAEIPEDHGYSSRASSPAQSVRRHSGPSSSRTLKLEFGPVGTQPSLKPEAQHELDCKIRAAEKKLKKKQDDYKEQLTLSNKTIDEIDSLARQYNDERRKAPVYPPKGTWFHQERKVFPRKKAEHEEKLRFILQLRQAVIDNDLSKAEGLLSKATEAMTCAQTKLDRLRREKHSRP